MDNITQYGLLSFLKAMLGNDPSQYWDLERSGCGIKKKYGAKELVVSRMYSMDVAIIYSRSFLQQCFSVYLVAQVKGRKPRKSDNKEEESLLQVFLKFWLK